MYFCYIDESGDSSTLVKHVNDSNPFFVLTGLIIHQDKLIKLTRDFIAIKKQFYPNLKPKRISTIDSEESIESNFLDGILAEVKGSTLRGQIRDNKKAPKQTAIGFVDQCLKLLERNDVKILGSTLIKDFDRKNRDDIFYGNSIIYFGTHFNAFLSEHKQSGIIIADSRKTNQNYRTSHTFFTQRHQFHRGNKFPHILESVTYGHSHNFAMLQLTDIVCSAILFPMYAFSYGGYVLEQVHNNVHISENFREVHFRFAKRIREMQYKYQNDEGRWIGGIRSVDNTPLGRKNKVLFQMPEVES